MSRLRFDPPPRLLDPGCAEYPSGLRTLEPPPTLCVAGRLRLDGPSVAIVGTRRADREAERFTEDLAAELAASGAVIVSGGARGIDTAAHRGALDAGGVTWAVLATGLEEAYPPENAPLFGEIVRRGGAVLSEVLEQVPPRKGRFHKRNRLVAAISDYLVLIQAPSRSGALSTAAFARRFEKPVLVVPSAPWDPLGEGGLALIRRGAKICMGAMDVLSLAGSGLPPKVRETKRRNPKFDDLSKLDDVQKVVLGVLSSRPRHVDELVRRAHLPIEDVQHALLGLILMGLAGDAGGGRYVVASPSRA